MSWPTYQRGEHTGIEAVRYGKDEDGRWYDGSVQRIGAFMLGGQPDTEVTEHELLSVVRPFGLWNPPDNCWLEMMDTAVRQIWVLVEIGDYIVKSPSGGFFVCSPKIFEAAYHREEVS